LHTNSTGIPDAVLAGPHCEGGWSDIFAEAGILAAAVSGMPGVVFLPFAAHLAGASAKAVADA